MDTRTGQIYDNFEAARQAGMREEGLAPVDVGAGFITVTNGPFKGRVYEITEQGKRGCRRKDKEV